MQLNKVNELIECLNKNEKAIKSENCQNEFKDLSDKLSVLSLLLFGDEISSKPYSYSNAFYACDRVIADLYFLKLPETAKTTNQVFKKVILEDLFNCFEFANAIQIPEDIHFLDYQGQAHYYAHLGSKVNDYPLKRQILLCQHACLRLQKSPESEIEKVEKELDSLILKHNIGSALEDNNVEAFKQYLDQVEFIDEGNLSLLLKLGREDFLKALIDKNKLAPQQSPKWLFEKAIKLKSSLLSSLFTFFPNLKINSKDLSLTLGSGFFNVLLKQLAQQSDNELSINELSRLYGCLSHFDIAIPEDLMLMLTYVFFNTNQLFTETSLDSLPFQLKNGIKENWNSLVKSAIMVPNQESLKRLACKQSPEWLLNIVIKLGGSLNHFFTIFPTVKVSTEHLLKDQTDSQFKILTQQFSSQSDNKMTLQDLLNCYQCLLKLHLQKSTLEALVMSFLNANLIFSLSSLDDILGTCTIPDELKTMLKYTVNSFSEAR